MMNSEREWFQSGDVARALGLTPSRFQSTMQAGHIREPAFRLGGRRMFTAEELEQAREDLAAWKSRNGRQVCVELRGPSARESGVRVELVESKSTKEKQK